MKRLLLAVLLAVITMVLIFLSIYAVALFFMYSVYLISNATREQLILAILSLPTLWLIYYYYNELE